MNDPLNVGTGRFTCKSTAAIVKLELRTIGVPSITKASKQFNVIQPDGVRMQLDPNFNTYHVQNTVSAGFKGEIYLTPMDVSFSNTEFREGAASYEGTGIFVRSSVGTAQLAVSYSTVHPVLGAWVRMDGGDSVATGSKCNGGDTV